MRCEMCALTLPAGTPTYRRFCDECRKWRKRERMRQHRKDHPKVNARAADRYRERYRTDPEFRERELERSRKRYWTELRSGRRPPRRPRVTNCEQCSTPLPADSHALLRFCDDCRAARALEAQRAYAARNRELKRERQREYARQPEVRERRREYERQPEVLERRREAARNYMRQKRADPVSGKQMRAHLRERWRTEPAFREAQRDANRQYEQRLRAERHDALDVDLTAVAEQLDQLSHSSGSRVGHDA